MNIIAQLEKQSKANRIRVANIVREYLNDDTIDTVSRNSLEDYVIEKFATVTDGELDYAWEELQSYKKDIEEQISVKDGKEIKLSFHFKPITDIKKVATARKIDWDIMSEIYEFLTKQAKIYETYGKFKIQAETKIEEVVPTFQHKYAFIGYPENVKEQIESTTNGIDKLATAYCYESGFNSIADKVKIKAYITLLEPKCESEFIEGVVQKKAAVQKTITEAEAYDYAMSNIKPENNIKNFEDFIKFMDESGYEVGLESGKRIWFAIEMKMKDMPISQQPAVEEKPAEPIQNEVKPEDEVITEEMENSEKSIKSSAKINKWVNEFVVQGHYGYGWDDLTTEETWQQAKQTLKEYNENETGVSHRIIRRKEINPEYKNENKSTETTTDTINQEDTTTISASAKTKIEANKFDDLEKYVKEVFGDEYTVYTESGMYTLAKRDKNSGGLSNTVYLGTANEMDKFIQRVVSLQDKGIVTINKNAYIEDINKIIKTVTETDKKADTKKTIKIYKSIEASNKKNALKLYKEISSFDQFQFWAGAKDNIKDYTDEEKEYLFEICEEIFPDGCTETELNDYIWFDSEDELITAGYRKSEDEENDEENKESSKKINSRAFKTSILGDNKGMFLVTIELKPEEVEKGIKILEEISAYDEVEEHFGLYQIYVLAGSETNAQKIVEEELSAIGFNKEAYKIKSVTKKESANHYSGATRRNKRMDKIFDRAKRFTQEEKKYLISLGIGEEEAEKLYNETGLHGDKLGEKIQELGKWDDFIKAWDEVSKENVKEAESYNLTDEDKETIKKIIKNFDPIAVKYNGNNDDGYSVLIKDKNSDFESWMDVWVDDKDVDVDWNQYIYHTDIIEDVMKRKIEDDTETVFDLSSSEAVHFLQDKGILVQDDNANWAYGKDMKNTGDKEAIKCEEPYGNRKQPGDLDKDLETAKMPYGDNKDASTEKQAVGEEKPSDISEMKKRPKEDTGYVEKGIVKDEEIKQIYDLAKTEKADIEEIKNRVKLATDSLMEQARLAKEKIEFDSGLQDKIKKLAEYSDMLYTKLETAGNVAVEVGDKLINSYNQINKKKASGTYAGLKDYLSKQGLDGMIEKYESTLETVETITAKVVEFPMTEKDKKADSNSGLEGMIDSALNAMKDLYSDIRELLVDGKDLKSELVTE